MPGHGQVQLDLGVLHRDGQRVGLAVGNIVGGAKGHDAHVVEIVLQRLEIVPVLQGNQAAAGASGDLTEPAGAVLVVAGGAAGKEGQIVGLVELQSLVVGGAAPLGADAIGEGQHILPVVHLRGGVGELVDIAQRLIEAAAVGGDGELVDGFLPRALRLVSFQHGLDVLGVHRDQDHLLMGAQLLAELLQVLDDVVHAGFHGGRQVHHHVDAGRVRLLVIDMHVLNAQLVCVQGGLDVREPVAGPVDLHLDLRHHRRHAAQVHQVGVVRHGAGDHAQNQKQDQDHTE